MLKFLQWDAEIIHFMVDIDKAWAKLKQLLRAAKARSREALDEAIAKLLPLITAEEAKA